MTTMPNAPVTGAATVPTQRMSSILDNTARGRTASAAREAPDRWCRAYRRRVLVTDLAVIVVTVLLVQLFSFGLTVTPTRLVGALALITAWYAAIGVNGARHRRVLGSGTGEYRRVLQACLHLFGGLAIIGFLADLQHLRGFLAVALPLGTVGLLAGRWVWRLLLREYRRAGTHLQRIVLAGPGDAVLELADRFADGPGLGFEVVGVCVPESDREVVRGVPFVHDPDGIAALVHSVGADTVAVTAHDFVGRERVRRLAWQLEGTGVQLTLAPSLTDVAGPRLHVKPVEGLALMVVEEPRFRGPKHLAKIALDWCIALAALVVASPILVITAVLIKKHDGGPVFFRHRRVGLGGRVFRVWKFRTMAVDAEARKDEVRAGSERADSVFFKSADDPRITRIGRVLRRTSIDELPQLFNVLAGQMSLVGPRPLVPGEGAEVGDFLERRMLVRPGITGLWQVSGRSDVSDAERIRMDFYYVENWSVAGDLVILLRTAAAVLRREGAY